MDFLSLNSDLYLFQMAHLKQNTKNNPLLHSFETPFSAVPFDQIKNEHFLPAFTTALKEAKKEVQELIDNSDKPTFSNTIEALENSGELLGRVSKVFFNLNSAETNEEIQKIAQEISPLLSTFANDIKLNPDLFKKIKDVYEHSPEDLTDEQKKLLSNAYKGFSRNGANLNEEDKQRIRKIDEKLSKLSLTFGENLLAETNNYQLLLSDIKELGGLAKDYLESAKKTAEEKNLEGWLITLQSPSFVPFLRFSTNRKRRKELALAYSSRCFRENEFNNEKLVLSLSKLRNERALILGYETHAHFILEERMAKNPKEVRSFLADLQGKAKPFALKEIKQLKAFAKELDGITDLNSWDHSYYAEKQKEKLFQLKEEELKPYFSLDNVLNGALTIAEKLYGLSFKKNKEIKTYHPEVEIYEVYEGDEFKALLYTDFFPREGKRSGAWMTSFKGQCIKDGENQRPHISIVCNFTPPTEGTPSLLTFGEVTTLFHEFGHALHGIMANTQYGSMSGTHVFWDFVELPSQFMENYCYEEEALSLFAQHHETKEVIPMELIAKIKASANYMEGYQCLRQISFGLVDMAWHGQETKEINDVSLHEKETTKEAQLYPPTEESNFSCGFAHIFQGGYSAGYYSYKWAEVLDADAFAYFKEKGIFDFTLAEKFKNTVLSKGGTVDPMDLYLQFRGQKPNNTALLKRAGLIH